MADRKASILDYINLTLTIFVGLLGIYIAVKVGRSADDLGRSGLIVSSATFLLDDTLKRQEAGVEIVCWLINKEIPIPYWEQKIIQKVAATSVTLAQNVAPSEPVITESAGSCGRPSTPISAPASAVPTTQSGLSNQLFAAVGGTLPRLFIQYPDSGQEQAANALRAAATQIPLNGTAILVPAVQQVSAAPNRLEVRYFRAEDSEEANALGKMMSKLLGGEQVAVNDRSHIGKNVRARTYELWFKHGQNVTCCNE